MFPDDERFGRTAQLRRCAVSIPSNIAEGHARESSKDFARFLSNALGSLDELESQLLIATKLEYIAGRRVDPLLKEAAEIGRMLRGEHTSILNRATSSTHK